jgi:predicted transcriptional regulator
VGVKRNVTVQLDEDVIAKVKVLAAQRGMSISGLVAAEIDRLTERKERYERAREWTLAQMAEVEERAATGDRGPDTEWRGWTREEIYAERTDRWLQR